MILLFQTLKALINRMLYLSSSTASLVYIPKEFSKIISSQTGTDYIVQRESFIDVVKSHFSVFFITYNLQQRLLSFQIYFPNKNYAVASLFLRFAFLGQSSFFLCYPSYSVPVL